MTDLRSAAQQALEALEYIYTETTVEEDKFIHAASAALRAALEQPEQDTDCHAQGICQRSGYGIGRPEQEPDRWGAGYEAGYAAGMAETKQERAKPVAWACFKNGDLQTELVGTEADVDFWCASDEPEMQGMVKGRLYTHPPRREWRGLTEEEIWKLYYDERVPEGERCDRVDFARAVEAALKELNHHE